jgi:hypothetical protein
MSPAAAAALCVCSQVSDAVVAAIEELEPVMEAIYSAQTAAGQSKWNEHLAVDLRLAGEGKPTSTLYICLLIYMFIQFDYMNVMCLCFLGQNKWKEHLAVDLLLAGEGYEYLPCDFCRILGIDVDI